MDDFVCVGTVDEFPDSGKKLVEVDDRLVVVIRQGDAFYCIDDVCTHDGGTLFEGRLVDGCIECPRHGARFDIRTGAARSMPATQPTGVHEIQVDGDRIYVKLKGKRDDAE